MIRCVDNGVGFDQRRQSRMFKLFSALHSFGEYSHVGLGTGLALAQRIMQRLEGSILAQSEGQGASFTIRLPMLEEAPNSRVPADIRYPI
jgi:signal transduction histidine kinase